MIRSRRIRLWSFGLLICGSSLWLAEFGSHISDQTSNYIQYYNLLVVLDIIVSERMESKGDKEHPFDDLRKCKDKLAKTLKELSKVERKLEKTQNYNKQLIEEVGRDLGRDIFYGTCI